MTTDLILGTAGHIDHGKTALIRALTGTDTDRLPEEKKRGITIELGFAELTIGEYRLGIVDVPGHERFVRNMLAGATGMDLAMLVVAADDSVKQQTREHLEILRLLDLPAGLIVLTKCDLADNDWIDLVEEEVRDLVAGSFLEQAPLVRTSAHAGAGIEELREALARQAETASASRAADEQAPFRMAIDRTFTIAGHGTVVTGSVSSGAVSVGDELLIEPGRHEVRVRGLQNHDRAAEQVTRGQRAAINLAGVHHEQIRRGQELCRPGHLTPSRRLTVSLSLLPQRPRPLKSRARARLHVGTAEVICGARLLDRSQLEPGETAPAQLFLADPVVSTWNQPYVLRSESPVDTIGGGRVLDPDAMPIRRPDEHELAMVRQLESSDPADRAAAAAYFAGLRPWRPEDLARTAGVGDPEQVYEGILSRGDVLELAASPTRKLRVHRLALERLCRRIDSVLRRMHDSQPLATALDRSRLASRFGYLEQPALFDAALSQMQKDRRVRLSAKGVALAGRGPQLSQNERKLLNWLIDRFRSAGYETPTVKQVQDEAARNQESAPELVKLAVAGGDLIEVAPDYFIHAETEEQLRRTTAEALASGKGLTLSELRELLGTTRKYAVPLCEYLDRIGHTRREGDLRVLAESESAE